MYRLCGEEKGKKIEKYGNIRITLHNNKLRIRRDHRSSSIKMDGLRKPEIYVDLPVWFYVSGASDHHSMNTRKHVMPRIPGKFLKGLHWELRYGWISGISYTLKKSVRI